jgi:hypothetical protein
MNRHPLPHASISVTDPKVLVLFPCLLLHGLWAFLDGTELFFVGILQDTQGYCFGCEGPFGVWEYRTRETYLMVGLATFAINTLCLIAMYVYFRGKWSVESGFVFWLVTIIFFATQFTFFRDDF